MYLCSNVGKIVQQFDYSREGDEKDFMCAVASPTGQSVVIGSFNRLVTGKRASWTYIVHFLKCCLLLQT